MIKDNQQYFNKLHVLIDALVIIVSYVFAWWLKFLSGILDHEVGVLSFEFYMRALLLIVPVYILLYYAFNLYTSKRVQGRRLEFSNIVMANTVGLLLMFAALFTLTSYNPQYRNFSREMLFYFYVTNIVVEEIVRLLIRRFLRSIRRRGYNLKHIRSSAIQERQSSISTEFSRIRSGDTMCEGYWMTILPEALPIRE